MFLPYARRWPGIALGVAVVAAAYLSWQSPPRKTVVSPSPEPRPAVAAGRPAPTVPGLHSGLPWEDVQGWTALPPRERLATLLASPFGLRSHGQVEHLTLARDELYLPKSGSLKSVPLQADSTALLRLAEKLGVQGGEQPRLVFYLSGEAPSVLTRRILSDTLLLHASGAPEPVVAAASGAGCVKVRAMGGVPGYVVAHDQHFPGSALLAAADLSRQAGVDSALPVLGRAIQKMSGVNDPTIDPFFKYQWHLKNTKQIYGAVAGTDVNVSPVWTAGIQGRGVVIGILDEAVEVSHPDLSPNYTPSLSYNFVLDQDAPQPLPGDNHGTCVAGVAVADGGNGVGLSGVAPQASFASLQLMSTMGTGEQSLEISFDDWQVSALGYRNDAIAIKNNSWGISLSPSMLGPESDAMLDALKSAATIGRAGRGVILNFAAGNGYDSGFGVFPAQGNKSALANSIYVCAIGSVSASGVRPPMAEYGAHLLACGPSAGPSDPGIATTDRVGVPGDTGYNPGTSGGDLPDQGYTNTFNGTSAAAAAVSGVEALMLQANPYLGWRDVKEILLRCGKQVNPTNKDWVSRPGGSTTLPPIKHNHQYGGGLVDATSAVGMASAWINLAPLGAPLTKSFTGPSQPIPDASATGTPVTLDFTQDTPTRVEQVEVVVSMTHPVRGQVAIDLVSPAGTVSHLALADPTDWGSDYPGWTFTSVRHWGESSAGAWKVIFYDGVPGSTGTVDGVVVRLYGAPSVPVTLSQPPQDMVASLGGPASWTATGAGTRDFSWQWSKGTT